METKFTAKPKIFIGMDIHKKSWSVHLRTDVSDHKSMTLPPNPAVLYNYVENNFPNYEVVLTYEAGCCGFSTARYFLNLGWNVLVVNPSDIPRMNKQNYQKTDLIDCRNLSKQLQQDQLRGIFIPDEIQDHLKSLVRQRAEITKQLRSIKSSIKALLLYQGIDIPEEHDNTNWTKAFLKWLKELNWATPVGKVCLDSKIRTYEFVHGEYLLLANELRAFCRKTYKTDYYLLKSIPGVGGYLASAILAEVGNLKRFNNEAEFASYVGIVPMIFNSGSTEKVIGVTPRCRALLRSYIIESAWVALRLDPIMQEYYRKHIGKNPKSIIVKIARKMLNRMLAVIKTGQPYQKNYSLNRGKETKKQTTKQRG